MKALFLGIFFYLEIFSKSIKHRSIFIQPLIDKYIINKKQITENILLFVSTGSGASRDSSPELGDGPRRPSNESLPSYTLVTGLPTYEQALEQAKLGVCLRPPQSLVSSMMAPPPPASPGPKMPPPPFHEVKS